MTPRRDPARELAARIHVERCLRCPDHRTLACDLDCRDLCRAIRRHARREVERAVQDTVETVVNRLARHKILAGTGPHGWLTDKEEDFNGLIDDAIAAIRARGGKGK